MPTGRVKWFSLEKGFGFISNDEGEDVYLAATSLPEGVTTVKPGTKIEFSIIDSRKGPQAMSVHVVDAPVSLAENSRVNSDDLAATSLPEGVATVKPGTKIEFSIIDSRKGPQAMSVRIADAPVSLAENSRVNSDDLAAMIEDTIKILDKVGNGLRHGRHPSGPDAERLGRVLRGIAGQLEA